MVCLLLKGLVDHNGKMDALLKRTSSVKVDLFQVICLSIRSNSNEGLGSAGGGGGSKVKASMLQHCKLCVLCIQMGHLFSGEVQTNAGYKRVGHA